VESVFPFFFAAIFPLFFCIFSKKWREKNVSLGTHAVAASSAAAAPAPPSASVSPADVALRNGFDAMTSAPAVGATAMTAVPRQTTSPRGRVSSVTVRMSSALRWYSIASSRTRLSSWS